MLLTIEQRRSILDDEIAKAIRQGWTLTLRTDTEAQLTKARKGNGCGCLSLGLLYWFFREKRPLGLYISVDESGKVRRTEQK